MARYLERRRSDIRDLRRALEAAEFETIRTTGHNLFGSGATYGLDVVSTIGRGIEEAAEAQNSARIGELIDNLERFVGDVKIR